MAVSLGLSRSGPVEADYSDGVCFEDDGYYWFLYPFFEEACKQTGQMIDPYGDAIFEPVHLPALLAVLEEAARSAEQQPEEWDVRLGWRGGQEVYCKVSKRKVQGMLTDFIALVKGAMAAGKNVVGYGD